MSPRPFPLPINVGTDLCSVPRILSILNSNCAHRFVSRLLTEDEVLQSDLRAAISDWLYAKKEAIYKARKLGMSNHHVYAMISQHEKDTSTNWMIADKENRLSELVTVARRAKDAVPWKRRRRRRRAGEKREQGMKGGWRLRTEAAKESSVPTQDQNDTRHHSREGEFRNLVSWRPQLNHEKAVHQDSYRKISFENDGEVRNLVSWKPLLNHEPVVRQNSHRNISLENDGEVPRDSSLSTALSHRPRCENERSQEGDGFILADQETNENLVMEEERARGLLESLQVKGAFSRERVERAPTSWSMNTETSRDSEGAASLQPGWQILSQNYKYGKEALRKKHGEAWEHAEATPESSSRNIRVYERPRRPSKRMLACIRRKEREDSKRSAELDVSANNGAQILSKTNAGGENDGGESRVTDHDKHAAALGKIPPPYSQEPTIKKPGFSKANKTKMTAELTKMTFAGPQEIDTAAGEGVKADDVVEEKTDLKPNLRTMFKSLAAWYNDFWTMKRGRREGIQAEPTLEPRIQTEHDLPLPRDHQQPEMDAIHRQVTPIEKKNPRGEHDLLSGQNQAEGEVAPTWTPYNQTEHDLYAPQSEAHPRCDARTPGFERDTPAERGDVTGIQKVGRSQSASGTNWDAMRGPLRAGAGEEFKSIPQRQFSAQKPASVPAKAEAAVTKPERSALRRHVRSDTDKTPEILDLLSDIRSMQRAAQSTPLGPGKKSDAMDAENSQGVNLGNVEVGLANDSGRLPQNERADESEIASKNRTSDESLLMRNVASPSPGVSAPRTKHVGLTFREESSSHKITNKRYRLRGEPRLVMWWSATRSVWISWVGKSSKAKEKLHQGQRFLEDMGLSHDWEAGVILTAEMRDQLRELGILATVYPERKEIEITLLDPLKSDAQSPECEDLTLQNPTESRLPGIDKVTYGSQTPQRISSQSTPLYQTACRSRLRLLLRQGAHVISESESGVTADVTEKLERLGLEAVNEGPKIVLRFTESYMQSPLVGRLRKLTSSERRRARLLKSWEKTVGDGDAESLHGRPSATTRGSTREEMIGLLHKGAEIIGGIEGGVTADTEAKLKDLGLEAVVQGDEITLRIAQVAESEEEAEKTPINDSMVDSDEVPIRTSYNTRPDREPLYASKPSPESAEILARLRQALKVTAEAEAEDELEEEVETYQEPGTMRHHSQLLKETHSSDDLGVKMGGVADTEAGKTLSVKRKARRFIARGKGSNSTGHSRRRHRERRHREQRQKMLQRSPTMHWRMKQLRLRESAGSFGGPGARFKNFAVRSGTAQAFSFETEARGYFAPGGRRRGARSKRYRVCQAAKYQARARADATAITLEERIERVLARTGSIRERVAKWRIRKFADKTGAVDESILETPITFEELYYIQGAEAYFGLSEALARLRRQHRRAFRKPRRRAAPVTTSDDIHLHGINPAERLRKQPGVVRTNEDGAVQEVAKQEEGFRDEQEVVEDEEVETARFPGSRPRQGREIQAIWDRTTKVWRDFRYADEGNASFYDNESRAMSDKEAEPSRKVDLGGETGSGDEVDLKSKVSSSKVSSTSKDDRPTAEEEIVQSIEQAYEKLRRAACFLAGRFAAKEAIIKAHHFRRLTYHSISILRPTLTPGHTGSFPPIAVVLPEPGKERVWDPLNGKTVSDEGQQVRLSISHDGLYATATCLAAEPWDPSVAMGMACPQYPALKALGAERQNFEKEVKDTISSPEFFEKSVKRMQGAVRIPTESFDDMGKVGNDTRWDIFQDFHAYLAETFPMVYSIEAGIHPDQHLFMGHQDVVPVPAVTESRWTYPPYSAHYDGRFVWGRGAADCKNVVIGVLGAFETLLEKDFKPERTLLAGFGFDEEISGPQGAKFIAEHLENTRGKDSIELILDEGGLGIAEMQGAVFALPGVGEKGYFDVRISVETAGGHSSVPPEHTGIGILAQIIAAIEAAPYTPDLTPLNPYFTTLQCTAEYSPDLDPWLRKTIKKSLSSKKAAKAVAEYVAGKDISQRYLMQTSQATDLISGGVKINALPEKVYAVVNHRIAVESHVAAVRAHLQSLLEREILSRFPFALEAWGSIVTAGNSSSSSSSSSSPSSALMGTITLENFDSPLEPAPVSPYDTHAYKTFTGTIKQVLGEDIIVAPSLMTGNTDTKFYWGLSRNIYRFSRVRAEGRADAHTVDERIGMREHVEGVRLYAQLVLNGGDGRQQALSREDV
ncbi:hypothetical protein LZ554_004783 [Drepanopeziza brunnea f. sp. 'monogermtubi']|nr:hypothetical protein LZ554_004783 [Drepanopeziza brunnea f. sp. 'monogermtubi']